MTIRGKRKRLEGEAQIASIQQAHSGSVMLYVYRRRIKPRMSLSWLEAGRWRELEFTVAGGLTFEVLPGSARPEGGLIAGLPTRQKVCISGKVYPILMATIVKLHVLSLPSICEVFASVWRVTLTAEDIYAAVAAYNVRAKAKAGAVAAGTSGLDNKDTGSSATGADGSSR